MCEMHGTDRCMQHLFYSLKFIVDINYNILFIIFIFNTSETQVRQAAFDWVELTMRGVCYAVDIYIK